MIPTAEEIANEIRMKCVYNTGPFILVEGSSDVTFFSCHTRINIENIIPSFGWENVTDTVAILESEGYNSIIGVIDLDYRGIIEYPDLPNNIVLTDSHDIETMMFCSPAFFKVLKQKSSIGKIKSYPSGMAGVKRKILNLSQLIGILRFYSQFKGNIYSFDNMHIHKFIDNKSLSFIKRRFLSHVRGIHPKNSSITEDTIKNATSEVKKIPTLSNHFRLCCGHDLMVIMSIGLKSVWGSYNSKEISGSSLEKSFILAYSHEMFMRSNLFQEIDKWFQSKGYLRIWAN